MDLLLIQLFSFMYQVLIKSIHITEYQQSTWGRVNVQYEREGQLYFAFKNWIKFNEKLYKGVGDLNDEPAYNWFEANKRHIYVNYQDVLNGVADNLYLTPEKYKLEYGTPSVILKRLLIEIKANIGESVENRRGWFNKLTDNTINFSKLIVDTKNKLFLVDYDVELKLEPLQKMVYLFYLKHPEGIKFTQIPDFKNELKNIYSKLSKSSDPEKIQKSVNELIDLSSNSLHEKISKINKKLKDELGEAIAHKYQIIGEPNQAYKINLNSDLISFT